MYTSAKRAPHGGAHEEPVGRRRSAKSRASKNGSHTSQGSSTVCRPDHTKPIRIGVVGCGDVMQGAYMPEIRKLQDQGKVEVTMVCHTKRERCQPVLDKWGLKHFTEDYRHVCNSPNIDLVLVLTSMQKHGPIAGEALKAGKHVLVEKPMAVTLDESAQLVRLAKESPGYLVCAPFVILSPTYQIVRNRVHMGDIGRICLARARYGWSGPDWAEWFYHFGGGPIFDLAVYNITSLTGILGPVKRVMAMTGTAIPVRTVKGESIEVSIEDNAQIMMDFGDSVFATVTTGFTMQKYRSPAIELYGTTGTLQILGDDWAPEGYELWKNEVGAWQYYYETDPRWMWTDGLNHVVDCIRQGKKPVVTPEHSYHVIEIMTAAQASGRSGIAQEITSIFSLPHFGDGPIEKEQEHRLHDRRRK
jgi:predicted dehydrogenase